LHHVIALAKVAQVIDRLTSSIDHEDLEVDGCETSLWEVEAALGVVTSRFFSARESRDERFASASGKTPSTDPHNRVSGGSNTMHFAGIRLACRPSLSYQRCLAA
jgi:hypothetical protein